MGTAFWKTVGVGTLKPALDKKLVSRSGGRDRQRDKYNKFLVF